MKFLFLSSFLITIYSLGFGQKLEMDANLMEVIFCDENVEYKFNGKDQMRPMPFVGKIIKNIDFPADSKQMTISFNPMVVPDAFYIKYGDQEYFSGFRGDVYNLEYKQVALSVEERKKMVPIQSSRVKEQIKQSLANGDNDYSEMDNVVRNFVGELVIYKKTEGLLESINAAIKGEGGKLDVKSIFQDGDDTAESITDEIIKTGNIKDNIVKYKGIMKTDEFVLNRQEGDQSITVIVFSALDRSLFKMNLSCK
jgi:hypothetical protein